MSTANEQTSEDVRLNLTNLLFERGKRMTSKRATEQEAALYLMYLLYTACNGGKDSTSSDELLSAVQDYLHPIWDTIILPTGSGVDELFFTPAYGRDVYVDVFHEVLPTILSKNIHNGLETISSHPSPDNRRPFDTFKTREDVFFCKLLLDAGTTELKVLHARPGFMPENDSSPWRFAQYDILLEKRSISFFINSLRKGIEGEKWSNVRILTKLPRTGNEYDLIHVELDRLSGQFILPLDKDTERPVELENTHSLPLSDTGAIICTLADYYSNDSNDRLSLFNRITHCAKLEIVMKLRFWRRGLVLVLRKELPENRPILFVDGQAYFRDSFGMSGFWEESTLELIRQRDARFVASVPRDRLVHGNLDPSFYILRERMYRPGYVPLKRYMSVGDKHPVNPEARYSGKVYELSDDPRLLPSEIIRDSTSPKVLWEHIVNKTSLLFHFMVRKWSCSYVEVQEGEAIRIPNSYDVYTVDTEIADIRYIVHIIRSIKTPALADWMFTSDTDILELPVPNLTIEEQQQFINNYLKRLRNEFNSKIDVKDTTLQLLVFTPSKEVFESLNKEKLDKLGFKVLKYAEDKSSLKEALSEHYGEKVLSSELADAVLVCADMPATEIQKAIFFVGKVGIRTFYYSNNPSFDSKEIDEDYLEDFNEGYVSGEDWLETIRKRLDAESYKVVDKYPRFFDAAQHLDEEYGWNLVEYATPILSSEPFDMNITKFRETLNNTILAFFQDHHIAPAELEGTAIAAFISDRRFTVSKKGITINLLEEDPGDNTFQKEAWYKHMLVAIRDFGNNDSHTEKEFDSSVKQAAFTIFMEIVIWLNSIRGRYRDRKCLFSIKKDGALLPIHPVESFEIDGRTYLVAGGVHLLDSKRELRNGSQVVILETEDDRFPKNINGQLISKLAKRSGYFIAIKD